MIVTLRDRFTFTIASRISELWQQPPIATTEQKAVLARILRSRYLKLREGALYNVDGRPPKDFAEGITIDTSLILIGLTECLGSCKEAEYVLREVIILFLNSIDVFSEEKQYIEAKKLNLHCQLDMLQEWSESGEVAPLDSVLLIGARLLFGNDDDLGGVAEEELRRIAKLLAPDAWPIYVRTLQVFGRSVAAACPTGAGAGRQASLS
jgi:hypothetical protein